eukprot:TRINITY_DN63072_c0_g1_i1.p1 TRINITY_DN63072_c0_g1~~TRINITY_DN63072_c0_g1_i1.p1  ORF type:complete len:197 (-),score=71.48 TRINITY_DN63072_c0_g1_i1:45-635(-)
MEAEDKMELTEGSNSPSGEDEEDEEIDWAAWEEEAERLRWEEENMTEEEKLERAIADEEERRKREQQDQGPVAPPKNNLVITERLHDVLTRARAACEDDERMAVTRERAEEALLTDIAKLGQMLDAASQDADVQDIIFPSDLIESPKFSFRLCKRHIFFELPTKAVVTVEAPLRYPFTPILVALEERFEGLGLRLG